MNDQIKDFVYAVAQGKAAESEEILNGIMSQKTVAALDDMRVEVAKNMFNPQRNEE
jgi:hypothetical protein